MFACLLFLVASLLAGLHHISPPTHYSKALPSTPHTSSRWSRYLHHCELLYLTKSEQSRAEQSSMDPVSGAMEMLPSKLLELLNKEYKLQKGVRADVKSLSKELESMYAALRKVATVPWEQLDDQIKLWACEVREASYDMEDVLDTFIIRVGNGPEPADPDHRVRRLLGKMGKLFDLGKAKARHDIAGAVEGIKKQLQEMSERRARYRIDDIVARPAATANVDPRLSHLYTNASKLVGIDEPMDELIRLLSKPDDKGMKIVAVVGLGGLGKTTLAKAVYDKVNLQFDCRAFVLVGRNPDPRKILRDILIDTESNKNANIILDIDKKRSTHVDLMQLDERQLIDILRKHLQDKRYLIVVDDIWDTSTWGIIKHAFVDGNFGSRIITTTRNSHISKEIGGEVYILPELSEKNSEELYCRIAFGGEEKRPCSAELDEISDKVIRKCHGVPLAIITIASVLASKPLEEWSSAYNSIGFGPDGDQHVENMKKILCFSYYDLPCHLRTCLLYLSIFPEEYVIERRDLILRWIAEGFVQMQKGKELFDIGDSYLHELINTNLIIPIEKKGSGLLYGCHVHDMVLHLIRDLSSIKNFSVVLNGEEQPPAEDNIRRLALQISIVKTGGYKDMPQLRSFYVKIGHTDFMPQVCSFKVLRVLSLEFCSAMEGYHIEHIAKLLHLRYLKISHTHVRKLPREIGRLKFLQTLILDDTGIEELPVSVCQLTQLMCLRVDKKMSVPEWIGKLTSLVELEMYHEVPYYIKESFSVVGPEMYRGVGNKCSTRQFVKELGKLTNLRVLKTGMNLQGEGQGKEFLESLRNLHKIQSIDISGLDPFYLMDVAMMEPSFALSSSIGVLDLCNPEFSRLPEWIDARLLPNLCQLSVVVSREDEKDLTALGKFTKLRVLLLVVTRGRRFKLAACGSEGFHNLISFGITKPLRFAPGAMPRLERISFSIPVAQLKDANIGLEFGLENLSFLLSVDAHINCRDACRMEVDEAEDVLQRAIGIHPNHPACELIKNNEDNMGPVDASSRVENRQVYMFLKSMFKMDAATNDLQDLYNAMYKEAVEMASSMPKEHPCVAKLASLPKQLAGGPVINADNVIELLDDSGQLMEKVEAQKRLGEEYNVEISRITAILEELETALGQTTAAAAAVQAGDDLSMIMISDHVAEEIEEEGVSLPASSLKQVRASSNQQFDYGCVPYEISTHRDNNNSTWLPK